MIIGAGAAGLMCAIEAGKRGRHVLVLDHAKRAAEKIRISGGGRCNFTNRNAAPACYQSQNPHFCKSALSRFTQHDFIKLVERHGIAYHEKTLGQLFCDGSSQQIIDMLLDECRAAGVDIRTGVSINAIRAEVQDERTIYIVQTSAGVVQAEGVVIATGGPSIPKMGATTFGYEVARQFGHNIIAPVAGLVPLTFTPELLAQTQPLSGVAVPQVRVSAENGTSFTEDMLFTHRGLSGPVILQISSYWRHGEFITVDLCPGHDVLALLKEARKAQPRQQLTTVLASLLPRRVAELWGSEERMADLADARLKSVADQLQRWRVRPAGSEGFRTAEVTLGGVDTREVSSKTFESSKAKGLYFIGEVLDVTGHLGGYNFQWAWSSRWCAGQVV